MKNIYRNVEVIKRIISTFTNRKTYVLEDHMCFRNVEVIKKIIPIFTNGTECRINFKFFYIYE